MKAFGRLLFGIAGLAMASSWAGQAGAITVATDAALTTSLAADRFDGVGSLGRIGQFGEAGHGCTGTLISLNVVLTAAHCVGFTSGPLGPTSRLFLPAAGDYNLAGGGDAYGLAYATVLTSYTGVGFADIALITLTTRAFGHTIYDLYTDHDEIGQVTTLVGAGMSGTLARGAIPWESDGRLRAGKNRYDLTGSAIGDNDDILLMDNDNGLAENDVFGRFFGTPDLGVFENGQLVEAGTIYGDSGGPDFIGNKISGVHSYGSSGIYYDPAYDGTANCGTPGSVDPLVGIINNTCVDGSFGELSGSVRVSYYASTIKSFVAAAAVPEPGTWTMMILGFGMTAMGMRRRRRTALALPA